MTDDDRATRAATGDTVAPEAPAGTDPTPSSTHEPRWARRVLLGVALLPFVTAAIRAIVDDWFPIGDSALLYIRTTDVGTRHHPWLGSWSSASTSLDTHINNPGPIYADLIAPFAHLFSPGVGNVLGVTTINVACLVGAAVAARRIGGWRFERWVLAAGTGLAWTMGSELLFDIFQAHALLFPFLLLLVLVVGVLQRLAWPWPWLALVTSVILQTHISYAYIVGLLGIAMSAVLVAETNAPRREQLGVALRSRTAGITAAVVGLAWAQSLLEQVVGPGRGNLARLAANASGTDVSVGAANSVKLVASIVSLPPWWTRPGFADTIEPAGRVTTSEGVVVEIPGMPSGGLAVFSLAVTLALLVLCLRRALRRSDRVLRAASIISITAVIGSILALSRLTVGVVGLAPHHTRWVFVVSLFAHLTLVWTAAEWLVARLVRGRAGSAVHDTTVLTAAIVVVFSLANVPMYAQQHGPTDDAHTMPTLRRLFEPLDELRDHQPVLYRADNLRVYEPYSSTIQLALRDLGIEFRVVEENLVRQLGNRRRADGTEPTTLAQFEAWAALGDDLPGCVLARASRFEPEYDAATAARAEALANRVATAEVDVSGVATAEGARDVDREFAERFVAGDLDAIREATYDGRLRTWLELGWATVGDEGLAADLSDQGPGITDWLDSVVALVVTPADVCGGAGR